jgi:hypothetical protein
MSYQTAAYHWTYGNWGKGTIAKDGSGSPDGFAMKWVDGLEPGVYSVEIDVFAQFGVPQTMANVTKNPDGSTTYSPNTIYCQFRHKNIDEVLYDADTKNNVLFYTSTVYMYSGDPPQATYWGLNSRFNVVYNAGDTFELHPPDKIIINPDYNPNDSDSKQNITVNFFQGASFGSMKFRVTKLC